MRICNTRDGGLLECKCGSWLKHWRQFSDQVLPAYCPELSCLRKDLHGAVVKKADSADNRRYVVPVCGAHRRVKVTLRISDSCALVPVDVHETCGKQT